MTKNEQNNTFSGGEQKGMAFSVTGEAKSDYVENQGIDIDLKALLPELTRLREELDKRKSTTEDYIAIGKVAEAEKEAEKGNSSKVWEILKTSGKWVLDTATDIGAKLAVEAIQKSMGL